MSSDEPRPDRSVRLPIDGREDASSITPEPEREGFRRFLRKHGAVKTTALLTLVSMLFSLILSVLVFWLRGLPVRTTGLVVAAMVPAIATPIVLLFVLRVFSRLERLEERHRQELTERMRTEESLREGEARFRSLFERSSDMIIIHDFRGDIVMANSKTSEILGYGTDKLLQMSVCDLAEDRSIEEHLARLGPDHELSFESSFRTRYGQTIDIEYSASVVDRERELVQGVIRDITERKHTENALLRAKEASEEASRLKSRFVFNVSHDIRTPLQGIIGFAEAILEEEEVDEAHNYAGKILDESETLLSLINDLLDLAKIEAGKLELDPTATDLHDLITSIMTSFKGQARKKNLELHWFFETETLRYVRIDVMRLKQVLFNLLSNAIKFTERGSVELTVSTLVPDANDEADMEHLFFAVSDTGIGIAPDKQELIFKSFVQADVSPTRKYTGIGLGTTIAQQLVQLMGGKIGLFSVPNEGSTFWFSIPLDRVPKEEAERRLSPSMEDTKKACRQARILVADDYPTNQLITKLQLEHGGHDVRVVSNGEQAVEACHEEVFDLIFMDLQMPVVDGREAARRIRASSTQNTQTPILAITASAEASTRVACVKSGMNDVIIKPIRSQQLLELVEGWLEHSATGSAPPSASTSPPSSVEQEVGDAGEALRDVPPIDLARALSNFASNQAMFESALAKFVEQTREDISRMRRMREETAWDDLRKDAHKIKGVAAYLGATPLSKAAELLEVACKRADAVTSDGAFVAFEKCVIELAVHLAK